MRKIISLVLIFGMLAVILNACTQSQVQKTEPVPSPSPQETVKTPAPQPTPEVPKETPKSSDPIKEANDTSGLDQSLQDLDDLD